MGGAFHGVRVLDLTQGYVSYCGLLFADLGADVIKVESPDGDYQRRLGPPFLEDDAAAFVAVNRGKRSLVLDWRGQAPDREILQELVRRADVVLSDLYADEAETAGLDADSLGRLNPQAVTCSVTPFGESGPDRNKRATELEIQGLSGVWKYIGSLKEPPIRLGIPLATMCGAIFAFQGTVAALIERKHSGRGQHLSVSLLSALLTMQTIQFVSESEPDEWIGHCLSPYRPPFQGFRAKDGTLLWTLDDDEAMRNFAKYVGVADRIDEMNLPDTNRWDRQEALHPIFEEGFRDRTVDDVISKVRELGGTAMPFHTFESLSHDAHALQLGLVTKVPGRSGDEIGAIGQPWEFSDGGVSEQKSYPLLGEHTKEILKELRTSV